MAVGPARPVSIPYTVDTSVAPYVVGDVQRRLTVADSLFMYELHEHEQYFFDAHTLDALGAWVKEMGFSSPCCLCCPLLGQALAERKIPVHILDIDERFAATPGFRRYDIYRPEWTSESYDLVICDPPFFNVSLSQLFGALRLVCHHDYSRPLLVCYLSRRSANVTGTFGRFGLRPTGIRPGYRTVQTNARNEIEFFTNLPDEAVERLRESMVRG